MVDPFVFYFCLAVNANSGSRSLSRTLEIDRGVCVKCFKRDLIFFFKSHL